MLVMYAAIIVKGRMYVEVIIIEHSLCLSIHDIE
jgi:hypothetical protein